MTDSDTPQINSPWQLAAWYTQKHGALVFGVATVITMWLVMVVPELDRNEKRDEVQRQLIEDLRQQTRDQAEIADHLRSTAQILDRITAKMETVQ